MCDVLIKNASIADGSGSKLFKADIAITGDAIERIATVIEGRAKTVVDANGLVASPGFIDIHCHSDQTILDYPLSESRILQGVTTEIGGNCGMSVAPLRQERKALLKAYIGDMPYEWASFGEYLDFMENAGGFSTNFGCEVGHGTIRIAAMGFENRRATASEMADMKALLRQSLSEGAFAMSSGLIYPPGMYADTEELSELAAELVSYNAFYATHMRNEMLDVVPSLEEAISVCRASGASLQVSHHKIANKKVWGLSRKTIELIDSARAEGLDVWADQYPYNASATYLSSNVPGWAFEGGTSAMVERLKDPVTRKLLADEANESHLDRWGDIVVGYVNSEKNRWMMGKSLIEIGDALGKTACDACFDIIIDEGNDANEINYGMSEEDIERIMSRPYVMPASDGYAYSMDYPGLPHPRCFGTFPRVISHYSGERKLFSTEEAIRRMTSLPAMRLNLKDRGFLKEGYKADIVLFDPNTIIDSPSYENPKQSCKGIRQVYVNGVLTAEDGVHTGARAGALLRRS